MSGRVCAGAYALANHTSLGLRGLWVGMLAGNGVVAVVWAGRGVPRPYRAGCVPGVVDVQPIPTQPFLALAE